MYHSYSKRNHTKQMNRKEPVRRWIAFLLTVCVLIPMTLSVTAQGNSAVLSDNIQLSSNKMVEVLPDLETRLDDQLELDLGKVQVADFRMSKSEILTNDNLPISISLADAKDKGLVSRVRDAETDMFSAVFTNENGGFTLYYFNEPIKYVDEFGAVKDKSDKLLRHGDGSFRTVASDIQTTLSKKLKDGITVSKDDYDLRLIPTGTLDIVGELSTDQKTVTYALDNATRYEYSLTTMGFKENIVVSEYTGQTEYSFTLMTDGLSPVKYYDTYVLVDNDGNAKATLSDIIIFTADERNNTFGNLKIDEIVRNSEYLLTIELDSEWLMDSNTAYPITIDPSIEYNTTGYIEDLVVSTDTDNIYSGTSGSLYVGKDSSGSAIRALMRFPTLDLSDCIVTNARIELRDLMCEGTTQTVECYEYIGATWQEGTEFAWSNMGSNSLGDMITSRDICYGAGDNAITGSSHRYVFYITSLAEKWASGAASPAKGVVFKATDSYEADEDKTTYRTFASINRASYQPSLIVNYESVTPTITLANTAVTINVGDTFQLNAYKTPASMELTYESSNPSIASVTNTGLITGVSYGNTIITVSGNGVRAECSVSVSADNYSVSFTKSIHTITGANGSTYYYLANYVNVTPVAASSNLRYTIYCSEEYRGAMSYNTTTGRLLPYTPCAVIVKVYFVDKPEVYDLCYVYADIIPSHQADKSMYIGHRTSCTFLSYYNSYTLSASPYTTSMMKKWEVFTIASGNTCMIRSLYNNKYLCCDSTGNIYYQDLPSSVFIPEEYMWSITTVGICSNTGYYLNRNTSTGRIETSQTPNSARWNYIACDSYIPLQALTVNTRLIGLGKNAYISISRVPSNATWGARTDVVYGGMNHISINTSGYISTNSLGKDSITVEFKGNSAISQVAAISVVETFLTNPNSSINSSYDRDSVYDYIIDYAVNPNPEFVEYSSDCTNFVSQCLEAGGMEMIGPPSTIAEHELYEEDLSHWYSVAIALDVGASITWIRADAFWKLWGYNNGSIGQCYQFIRYDSASGIDEDLDYLISILRPGDLIGQIKNDSTCNHMMIIQAITESDIIYAQHSDDGKDLSLRAMINKYNGKSSDFFFIRIAQN